MFCLEMMEGVGRRRGGLHWMPPFSWMQGEAAGRKEAGHRELGVRSCGCW